MPSMTLMMSTIFFELSLIEAMVCTTSSTTLPPLTAMSEALAASWLACLAFSAFCRTVEVSSSMLRCGLFQAGGLFFGALRQVGVALRDFLRGGGDGVGGVAHFADDAERRLYVHVLQCAHAVAPDRHCGWIRTCRTNPRRQARAQHVPRL